MRNDEIGLINRTILKTITFLQKKLVKYIKGLHHLGFDSKIRKVCHIVSVMLVKLHLDVYNSSLDKLEKVQMTDKSFRNRIRQVLTIAPCKNPNYRRLHTFFIDTIVNEYIEDVKEYEKDAIRFFRNTLQS